MNKEKREIIASRGFYYMPAALITLKVTVEGIYDSEKMRSAISRLEYAHPTINDIVTRDGGKMWFEDTGSHIRLVEYLSADSMRWEDAIKRVLQEPVNLTETPGFIVSIVEKEDKFYVLLICHHMYGDGVSVKQLADDLLYLYSTGAKLEVREPMTMLNEKNLPYDCKIPYKLREKLTNINKTWENRKIEFSQESYEKMSEVHHQTAGYEITVTKLKGTDYRKFRGKCKELGITVNSAITTAITEAIQKEAAGVTAMIAVNTRPLLGYEAEKGIANYASCVQPLLQYNRLFDFWENAVQCDKIIKEVLKDKQNVLKSLHTFMLLNADIFGAAYYARYGMYRDMEVILSLKDAFDLGAASETFDLSNIGDISFEANSEDFVVRDCYFIPNVTLACDCTFGVISLGNTLTISLGYKSNFVKEDVAKRFLNRVRDHLVNV